MRIDKDKRVSDIYLDTYPITAIYIGTELYYERQTGAIAYTSSGDGTYYIVIGEGSEPNGVVNIPNEHRNKPVKEIAQNAFSGKEITSLTIPENITSIKNNAFKNCYKLSSIYFNAKNCQDNEYSTKDAFYNVGKDTTTDITFGTNVEKIPIYMFRYSDYINKVDLSASSKLKEIPSHAFDSCTNLNNVTFSNFIEKIEEYAFSRTNLSSITLPNNLKEIEEYAFLRTNLSSITIPSNVTAIGNNAFITCDDVTYNGNAQNFIDLIGYPFPNKASSTFNLNATISLKNILNEQDYTPIILDGTVIKPITGYSEYDTIDKTAYKGKGGITRVIISSGITTIGEEAFHSCRDLTEIYIPKSVTSIGKDAFMPTSSTTKIEKFYYEGNYGEWINLNSPIYDESGISKYETGLPMTATIYYNQPMYKYVNTK